MFKFLRIRRKIKLNKQDFILYGLFFALAKTLNVDREELIKNLGELVKDSSYVGEFDELIKKVHKTYTEAEEE